VCAGGPKPHKRDARCGHVAGPQNHSKFVLEMRPNKWVRGARFVCMHRWALPSIYADSFRRPGSNARYHWMCP
jgi:hypothetical protein